MDIVKKETGRNFQFPFDCFNLRFYFLMQIDY